MGATPLSEEDVRNIVKQMEQEWLGHEYDLLSRNCCHFSDVLCRRIGVGFIPRWVLNLAGTGAALRGDFSRAAEHVDKAITHINRAMGTAAVKATELDAKYQITSAVDEFTAQEVVIDEEYIGAQVQGLLQR